MSRAILLCLILMGSLFFSGCDTRDYTDHGSDQADQWVKKINDQWTARIDHEGERYTVKFFQGDILKHEESYISDTNIAMMSVEQNRFSILMNRGATKNQFIRPAWVIHENQVYFFDNPGGCPPLAGPNRLLTQTGGSAGGAGVNSYDLLKDFGNENAGAAFRVTKVGKTYNLENLDGVDRVFATTFTLTHTDQ